MDPRGLRTHLSGAGCTGCGAAIPADRITVLADRGDLAVVELRCAACGAENLGIVLSGPAAGTPGEPRPIAQADVDAVHALLDGWGGDLHSLLDRRGGHQPRTR